MVWDLRAKSQTTILTTAHSLAGWVKHVYTTQHITQCAHIIYRGRLAREHERGIWDYSKYTGLQVQIPLQMARPTTGQSASDSFMKSDSYVHRTDIDIECGVEYSGFRLVIHRE